MALSDADTARLATLRAGYDQLLLGTNTVRVQTANGRLVEKGQGDIAALKAEIDQLAAMQASTSANPRRSGALRFEIR